MRRSRAWLLLASVFPAAVASSAAGQETLIGLVGRDFIVLGADSSSSSSVALTSSSLDKIRVLSDPFPIEHGENYNRGTFGGWEQQPIAAAAAGDSADADRLLSVLAAHCAIREYETGVGCDVETVYDGDSEAAAENSNKFVMAPSGLDADSVAHLARKEIATALRSRGQLRLNLLIAGMVKANPSSFSAKREGVLDDGSVASSNRRASDSSTFSARIRHQVKAATSTIAVKNGNGNALDESTSSTVGREAVNMKDVGSKENLVPHLFWLDEYGSIQKLQYGAHGYASNFALSILDRGYHPDMTREEAASLVQDCFEQLRMRYVINSPNPPCIKCVDADGCRLL